LLTLHCLTTKKDLLKNTWPEHPDYHNIKSAYDTLLQIAQFVEDSQEASFNIAKIIAIQQELVGKTADKLKLLQPGRKLVREGEMTERTDSGAVKKRYVYLFSDLLLITTQKKSAHKKVTAHHLLENLSALRKGMSWRQVPVCACACAGLIES
jgi:hypothetical protein